MRRVFWILITPLAGILVLWLIGSQFLGPKLESWILTKVQTYSEESLPLTLRAERLQLHLFKPSLSAEGVEVIPKGELAQSLKPIRIGSVRIFLDFFTLLGGRVHLSAVVVDSPELELDIDPLLQSDQPAAELPIDEIFAQTEKIPLQRLFLRNIQVKVLSKKYKTESALHSGDLLVTNMGKNLTLKASVPSLQVEVDRIGSFEGSLDTHLYLTRQSLRILQLGVRLDQSELLARGEINPISQVTIKPQGVLNVSGKLSLKDIYEEMKRLRPKLEAPAFAGQLDMESDIRFKSLEDIQAKAEIKTQDVIVGQLQMGNASIQGEYKDRIVSLSEIKLQHPSGEATVTRSQISLKDEYAFKAQASVAQMDVQKLFHSLNLNNIPVGMSLSGTVPCEGHFYPEIEVTCDDVQISAKNLWVKSGMDKKATSILELDGMKAAGLVQISTKSVRYSAEVGLGDNTGTSDGIIDFDKGFKINYATKKLDFKNVKNLANLKLRGSAEIQGSTSGGTDAAIFDMSANARDFVFEDFTLGNLIANLRYRGGTLNFEEIAGALNKTQYVGDLSLDLNHDRLSGEFSVPSVDLADVSTVFSQIFTLPFPVQGQGAAKAKISGPLNFWKMDYKLESAFKNVFIGPESFDALTFNVSADDGNIKTDNVTLIKGDAVLGLRGGISSDQMMNLYADGKNFRLEQSDIISKINSSLIGNLNFSAELKESVKDPHIAIKGSITDTSFNEQDIPNSNFILQVRKDLLGAQVHLFGDRVQGEIEVPFEQNRRPLTIKVNTKEWNYSTLLGLFGGASLVGEYDSALTSQIDLRSESGSILKSTGHINVDKFELKRGNLSLTNPAPMKINMKDGLTSIQDFRLVGPNADFSIRGSNFTAERLDMDLNLQSDMRLFQIFLPFLEDLGGGINISTKMSGAWNKPSILGNLSSRNVFLKIKGLPHPIERLNTEVVFSQSRILVSSVRGVMAGGTLSGDGGILINGIRDLPTSIRLRLDGVTFNVPDKVRSSGNADLLFAGRWFPFTLSGTYYISNALMEKEITEGSGGVTGVRQSMYLPKFIRESQFEPVILDLQLILENNIAVKNSLLDGSVSGNLQVKGPPGNPVLLGRITTDRNTKLIVKDRVFEIQSGVIDFNDPDEINPNLYITAITRVNEYDVTVVAQGTAKNLTIRFSSIPPLPENDIISLIALGVITSSKDQNLQGGQSEKVGAEIGGAVLAAPINKQLEATGFNVAVTQQYDSYRSVSVPKITLSRRLTDKVKIIGSRPVGDSQSYDVRMEYQINSNYTAVGSFESRGNDNTSTGLGQSTETTTGAQENIFGLDLEFKREFK
ncbi:hypothetical protein AZI86_15155 [Bdellovibrio bacteriovorus]|uniref:Translocation and assembly module TamB C-terminal domain-containing protein n=1 Tax=Bdellovibrio bacteriovorus TaxID=959 RepID=A0A150WHF1_BDEBC|nr:translocation/assembly module TamB domain-containing protein [Bdellovibrio bacteriovorus]KYG63056.1 hypothetical protein AZI86_15155 [Bdellovibrio bacteriovorus]